MMQDFFEDWKVEGFFGGSADEMDVEGFDGGEIGH